MYPKRLALFTRMGEVDLNRQFQLEVSDDDGIKFIEKCSEEDIQKFRKALECYETYQEVIEASNVKNVVTNRLTSKFLERILRGGWRAYQKE